jgi:hypothetical protein
MHINTRYMAFSVVQCIFWTLRNFQLYCIFHSVLDSKDSLPIIKDSSVSLFSSIWIYITISDCPKINFNIIPRYVRPPNLKFAEGYFVFVISHTRYTYSSYVYIYARACVCVCVCMRTCVILHEPIYYCCHYYAMFLAVQHYITVPSLPGLALFVNLLLNLKNNFFDIMPAAISTQVYPRIRKCMSYFQIFQVFVPLHFYVPSSFPLRFSFPIWFTLWNVLFRKFTEFSSPCHKVEAQQIAYLFHSDQIKTLLIPDLFTNE